MAEDIEILAAGTGADTAGPIEVHNRPMTVQLFGTLTGFVGDVQRKASNGTYYDFYDENGKVTLGPSRPNYKIWDGGDFQVNVTARPNSSGVSMCAGPGGR